MATITISDDLIARVRASDRKKLEDPNEQVAHALEEYVKLTAAEREGLIRRARARGEALRRAGISEEEVIEEFDQSRRTEMTEHLKVVREALAKAGISLSEEEVVKRVHEWRSRAHHRH